MYVFELGSERVELTRVPPWHFLALAVDPAHEFELESS